MRLPDRELAVHHTGEGWRCPGCFKVATIFYGIAPKRLCRPCWERRP